ncbi:hypothetical protein D6C97_03099 [Aureobasidium pullulans]|nr:hypothetical protein D6C97_03099 [Aureobasidium pullulans]
MLSLLTLGLLTRLVLMVCTMALSYASQSIADLCTGPWHALNVSWDNNPLQTFSMLPSLTKTSLLIAEDACSRQQSICPNQVQSGDWPMWTSSAAHEPYLKMDSNLFGADSWDDTVSSPLNVSGDGQWVHERGIIWNTDNDSAVLNDQAVTLTHNFTVNYPGREGYTVNTGYFSLYGAEKSATWLNATGSNVTQDLQLATVQNVSAASSLSYGLHIGSPSLNITPSLVLGGYDKSRCLGGLVTSHSQTFRLVNIGYGAEGRGWPFTTGGHNPVNASSNSRGGLLVNNAPLQVLANPGVPYMYLPRDSCDAIVEYLPVTFDPELGLYIWNTTDQHYTEITKKLAWLSFTFVSSLNTPKEAEGKIYVPFALLDLELDSPLTTSKTRYFPCSPFTPREGQPYHLGRAFLQATLLAQNWETNTTWLAQGPGPDPIEAPQPVTIDRDDTTISLVNWVRPWSDTWNTTIPYSDWSSLHDVKAPDSTSLSGGEIAGVVIGVVAAISIIAAAVFFIRRRRSKAEYGDVDLISFADSESGTPKAMELETKGPVEAASSHIYEVDSEAALEAASSPIFEVDSPGKYPHVSELPFSPAKGHIAELDGGIAELPAHDVHSKFKTS